jgi:hypothetical protein
MCRSIYLGLMHCPTNYLLSYTSKLYAKNCARQLIFGPGLGGPDD